MVWRMQTILSQNPKRDRRQDRWYYRMAAFSGYAFSIDQEDRTNDSPNMDLGATGLSGRVVALRGLPHLCDPAIPASGGAGTGAGAGGGSIPAGTHHPQRDGGRAGADRILARATAEAMASLAGRGRGP